jgi:hypothetical protein
LPNGTYNLLLVLKDMTQLNQVIDSIQEFIYLFFRKKPRKWRLLSLLLEEQERSKTIQQELNYCWRRIGKKANMKPGDIRMMLNESTDYSNSKHQQLQEIHLLESKD